MLNNKEGMQAVRAVKSSSVEVESMYRAFAHLMLLFANGSLSPKCTTRLFQVTSNIMSVILTLTGSISTEIFEYITEADLDKITDHEAITATGIIAGYILYSRYSTN